MTLVNGQECDTLLKIAHQAIVYKDTTIASQKRTIEKQEVRQLDTEHLADEYKGQKEAAEQALKDEQKKKKWSKYLCDTKLKDIVSTAAWATALPCARR